MRRIAVVVIAFMLAFAGLTLAQVHTTVKLGPRDIQYGQDFSRPSRTVAGSTITCPAMNPVNIRGLNSGAVTGDGTTDDTEAIQAAIDSVNSWGGGVLYFPPGTYRITSTLHMRDNLTLRGDHELESTLYTESAIDMVDGYLSGASDYANYGRVENLEFNGGGVATCGLTVRRGKVWNIDKCRFTDINGSSLRFEQVWDSWVTKCRFMNMDNADSAVVLLDDGAWSNNTNNIKFFQCTWETIAGTAISSQGGTGSGQGNNNIYISECKFEPNAQVDVIDLDYSFGVYFNTDQFTMARGADSTTVAIRANKSGGVFLRSAWLEYNGTGTYENRLAELTDTDGFSLIGCMVFGRADETDPLVLATDELKNGYSAWGVAVLDSDTWEIAPYATVFGVAEGGVDQWGRNIFPGRLVVAGASTAELALKTNKSDGVGWQARADSTNGLLRILKTTPSGEVECLRLHDDAAASFGMMTRAYMSPSVDSDVKSDTLSAGTANFIVCSDAQADTVHYIGGGTNGQALTILSAPADGVVLAEGGNMALSSVFSGDTGAISLIYYEGTWYETGRSDN